MCPLGVRVFALDFSVRLGLQSCGLDRVMHCVFAPGFPLGGRAWNIPSVSNS
jgi:hypothetical protein